MPKSHWASPVFCNRSCLFLALVIGMSLVLGCQGDDSGGGDGSRDGEAGSPVGAMEAGGEAGSFSEL